MNFLINEFLVEKYWPGLRSTITGVDRWAGIYLFLAVERKRVPKSFWTPYISEILFFLSLTFVVRLTANSNSYPSELHRYRNGHASWYKYTRISCCH